MERFLFGKHDVILFKSQVTFIIILTTLLSSNIFAQQVADTAFTYNNTSPAYDYGKGPLVLIDAAHNNFHTKDSGFAPFAKLLEQDGYKVESISQCLDDGDKLNSCKILVIANALHTTNKENWTLPTPSAFTDGEIKVIRDWAKNGGSLFLIADHMPFAGAAYDLGKSFGFEFVNGFAHTTEHSWPPSVFKTEDNTLCDSPLLYDKNRNDKIEEIATFTGSAFKAPKEAIPVLRFMTDNYSLQPDTAWQINDKTPKISLKSYLQGAIMNYGKGRIAVFGEAAMFTAQIANGNFPVGFNSPNARSNVIFLLNLIHWLDNKIIIK